MIANDNNAMTEVALALAMAFFALFVLASVSMSRDVMQTTVHSELARDSRAISPPEADTSAPPSGPDSQLVVFYQGRFFDQSLNVVAPSALVPDSDTQVVLGISPNLSLNELFEIKALKKHPNLRITLLNRAWLDRLEQIQ